MTAPHGDRRYWGGGVFCAENTGGLPAAPLDCYDETGTLLPPGTCFQPQIVPKCNGNGEVLLPYGSAEYMGLGFSVFATLVVVELFGSPAMRNVQVHLSAVTIRRRAQETAACRATMEHTHGAPLHVHNSYHVRSRAVFTL